METIENVSCNQRNSVLRGKWLDFPIAMLHHIVATMMVYLVLTFNDLTTQNHS